MFQHFSKTFLAGLLTTLPIILTIVVLYWMVFYIHKFLGPESLIGEFLSSIGLQFARSEVVAYLLGITLTIGLIYLLGLLSTHILKGRILRWLGMVLNRIPLVGKLYSAIQKLISIFDQQEQTDLKAMSAVMCHFGDENSTAMLALLPSPKTVMIKGRAHYGVLIPTAPVPFGGAIIYIPAEKVEHVDMAFDELLNVYMSMGATSSEYIRFKQNAT